MTMMADSSVNTRVAQRDDGWMRCFVHILNNCMKFAFRKCNGGPLLRDIVNEFKSLKRILEDRKRYSCNFILPNGFHLIQDVEIRFGKNYLVPERFLKSVDKAWNIILTYNRPLHAMHSNL